VPTVQAAKPRRGGFAEEGEASMSEIIGFGWQELLFAWS
jgi:hypothetical protein